MNFALSAENVMLRDVARSFFAKEFDVGMLLKPGATLAAAGYDALWSRMSALGWPAMAIPEACGGLGMTCIDVAMIVGEAGGSLAPSPLVGNLAATWALLRTGTPEQLAGLLPDVAAGTLRLALAFADSKGCFDPATVRAGDGKLTGTHHFVLDAAGADGFVVAARDAAGADAFYLVARGAAGVAIEATPWRDITRQVGIARFDHAPAERLTSEGCEAWPWIRDRLYLVLAAESAAGLHRVLADTVDYARQRVAFGRPIGAYQAIKHTLAEIKGWSECASTAVLYAAWMLSEAQPDATVAAAMAQSYASEAFRNAAFRSIQIFGAIGFTWEMPCHLHYKRARCNAELLGSPATQRAEIAAILQARASLKSECHGA